MIGPCIYFLIQNGQIIYIGQTDNLTRRLKQHKISHDSCRAISCHVEKLNHYEERWINKFKPKFNGDIWHSYTRMNRKAIRDVRITFRAEPSFISMVNERSNSLGINSSEYLRKLAIEDCKK